MYQKISRDELKAWLDEGKAIYLAEALPQKYFDEGHLPGAIHLPHDEVETLASQRMPNKTRAVVVYCASQTCNNSRIAANHLSQLGYTQVFAYEGGKQDWTEGGLTLERETQAA